MIETFIALVFAHVFADYAFQTDWMVERKRNPLILLLHGFVVLAASLLAVGHLYSSVVIGVALLHLLIDAAKVYGFTDSLSAHLADQAAHLIVIAALAAYAPELWQTGIWSAQSAWLPHFMLIAAGALFATSAGGVVVGMLMTPLANSFSADGLPRGGKLIGLLERGLIFVLILSGQAAGVGFLIAAKSIMRFEAETKQKAAEYVIIGTLASFGWAITVAMITRLLLGSLPELVIGDAVTYVGVTNPCEGAG